MTDVFTTLAQECADLQTERDHLAGQIADAWVSLGFDDGAPPTSGQTLAAQIDADARERRAALGAWDDESESVVQRIEALVVIADAYSDVPDLLRAYLVSIGLPAHPITFDSPELRALAEAVFG